MYRESLSHLQRVSSMNVSLVCKLSIVLALANRVLSLSPLVFRLLYTHTHIYRRGVWYILLIAWCVHHFFIWSGSVLSALYTASSTLSLCVCVYARREPQYSLRRKSLSPLLYTLDSTLTVVRRFPTSIKTTKLNNFLPFVLMMYTSEQTPPLHPPARCSSLKTLNLLLSEKKNKKTKNKIEKLMRSASSAAVALLRSTRPQSHPRAWH